MAEKQSKSWIVPFIWIFTAVVYILVIVLHELPQAESQPGFVSHLPLVNATINGLCFAILLLSLGFIRKGKVYVHQRLNTTAMILSVLFLLSYTVHHYFAADTEYLGNFKGLYYFVLVTHILLAGISLPFILLSYYHGLSDNRARHKKLVRFTYPVWLYVTFSGVLVYLFLSPYYA